jgi:NitT/TauT family transport system substrate-binding protein
MKRGITTLAAIGLLAVAGCASSSSPPARPGQAGYSGSLAGTDNRPVLRLGLITDITDATGLIGLDMRYFQQNLGAQVTLQPVFYTTGAQEETALLAGKLDAAYTDPITAVSAGQADGGSLIRIVSGAASGGSELIARKAIKSAADLHATQLASPETATQAAALRYWFRQHHQAPAPGSPTTGGAQAVRQFATGQIAAAWEPPPYDTLMAADGGHVLANEASSWPHGQFTSAVLVVTGKLLSQRPAVVTDLLKGQIQANQFINADKTEAEGLAGNELAAALGQGIPASRLAAAFTQVTYTNNPLATTLLTQARQAAAVGLLKPVRNLRTLLDLTPLNQLLIAAGQDPVKR